MYPMNRIFMTIACWTVLGLAAPLGCAGVVVLQNWTPVKIDYVLRQADGQPEPPEHRADRHRLDPGHGADRDHPGRRAGRPQLSP